MFLARVCGKSFPGFYLLFHLVTGTGTSAPAQAHPQADHCSKIFPSSAPPAKREEMLKSYSRNPTCPEPIHLEEVVSQALLGCPVSLWNNPWTLMRGWALCELIFWALGLYAREHCLVHGREHLKPVLEITDLQRQLIEKLARVFFLTASRCELFGLLWLGKIPGWEFGIEAFTQGLPLPTRERNEGCALLWSSGT